MLRESASALMTAAGAHLGPPSASASPAAPTSPTRRDVLALWGGILFSLLFTGAIWLAGARLDSIPKLPDQGYAWYFWKLPEPTIWSRATAWGGYVAHQLAAWGLILYAQRRVARYTAGLHPVNAVALAVNAGFVVLHFVQTHVWYDGLAQDVSIFSSQGSVILLLVWVLLMENDRRGLFFGRHAPIARQVGRFAQRYHGYVFSWAAIYTFWYHPMEATSGHLIGFFYMFLLLLQGSLFFTRVHTNRWWTFALEALVLVHGALVAVMQGNGLWPMFTLGFAGLIVVTQMHGLGLSRAQKWGILAAYVAGTALAYNWRGWGRLDEVLRIPQIEYVSVFALAALFWLGLRLFGRDSSPPTALRSRARQ